MEHGVATQGLRQRAFSIQSRSEELFAMGGLYETRADVVRPTSCDELVALFEMARATRRRLTLVGGRRSFGEQFLPPGGALAVDTTALRGEIRVVGRDAGGDLWVHAPGSATFEQLCAAVPGHIPRHPPTGDRITLAGALAACTHDAASYFAEYVRAFRVVTPDGRLHSCAADAPGVAGDLFRYVPGSLGMLGVIVDLELRMRAVSPDERAEVCVLENTRAEGFAVLDVLEGLFQRREYTLGRGLFFYGCPGRAILFGDQLIDRHQRPKLRPLPLIDDAIARNVALQGLANRFPRVMHRVPPLVLRKGSQFHADLYGFSFFQRSYDRAHEVLASSGLVPRALRGIGVDPRLSVCHVTFAMPAVHGRAFLELYFAQLKRHNELVAQLEQQDMVRLPESRSPLHATHGMSGGAYLFTSSMSVRRSGHSESSARRFFKGFSLLAFERTGAKPMLHKQTHATPEVLRRMHAPTCGELRRLRQSTGAAEILTSRLCDALGV